MRDRREVIQAAVRYWDETEYLSIAHHRVVRTVEKALADFEALPDPVLEAKDRELRERAEKAEAELARLRAIEPHRGHAPWCRWTHDGACPGENDPAPDHPVWAELERLRAVEDGVIEFFHKLDVNGSCLAAVDVGIYAKAAGRLRAALVSGESEPSP